MKNQWIAALQFLISSFSVEKTIFALNEIIKSFRKNIQQSFNIHSWMLIKETICLVQELSFLCRIIKKKLCELEYWNCIFDLVNILFYGKWDLQEDYGNFLFFFRIFSFSSKVIVWKTIIWELNLKDRKMIDWHVVLGGSWNFRSFTEFLRQNSTNRLDFVWVKLLKLNSNLSPKFNAMKRNLIVQPQFIIDQILF